MFGLFIFLLTANTLFSQQFYFNGNAFTDPAQMDKNIPGLAERLILVYKKKPPGDRIIFYNQLYRYEMVAGQYKMALNYLDSMRMLYDREDPLVSATNGFPFLIYARVKLKMGDTGISFAEAFDSIFSVAYTSLSDRASGQADNFFDVDLNFRQANYLNEVARLKLDKRDSISLNEAKSLCFNYLNYQVYTMELPLARPLLKTLTDINYIIADSQMITMRDGSQVSATIVRKRNMASPQPVVLKFGIYASESEVREAKFISAHGYIGIIADTRGKRLSKDQIEPFEHDASDAYDIIDWVSKQPWCNGKIGIYGGSYLGFTSWAAVKKVHPALKTIVPMAAVGIGIDFPALYGVYDPDMLNWLHFVMNNKLTDGKSNGSGAKWDSLYLSLYKSGKALNFLDTMEGRPNKTFHRFLDHPALDEFWTSMVPYKQEYADIHIPILTVTGYYDDDQRGAMYYFDQHHLYNTNPDHYLLIGPFDHYGAQGYPLDPRPVIEGYNIDTVAKIKLMDLVFQWFDYILKDSSKPDLLSDKINLEVMGANRWRHLPSIQKMNNDSITFYLSDIREGVGYKLLVKPGLKNGTINQEIDLSNKNDTINNEGYFINGDGEKIIDSSLRLGSYIRFESEPTDHTFDLNGSFLASLNAIINKKDMDLSINLYQQLPEGQYFQLSNNIARCSYIKDISHRELLMPGKKENIFFDQTFFTSRHIVKGSRIILLIGVNKNHIWEINYGSGKNVSAENKADAGSPLEIKWLTENSFIKLPVWNY